MVRFSPETAAMQRIPLHPSRLQQHSEAKASPLPLDLTVHSPLIFLPPTGLVVLPD